MAAHLQQKLAKALSGSFDAEVTLQTLSIQLLLLLQVLMMGEVSQTLLRDQALQLSQPLLSDDILSVKLLVQQVMVQVLQVQ